MRGAHRSLCVLWLVFACAVPMALAQSPAAERLPAPADRLVVVASPRDDEANVLLVNNDRLELLKSIKTGKGPTDVCVSPDGLKAYVTNTGGTGITVIDLTTLTVSATLSDASLQRPVGVAMTPDGTKLYVGARGTGALVVMTPAGQVLKQLPVKDPTTVAIAADGKRAYVASDSTESVLVVDTSTDEVTATIKTSRQPRGIAFTPDGKTILITCVAHDVMYYVNAATNQVETIVGIGRSPQSVAVAPDGRLAFSVTRDLRPEGAVSTVTIMDLRRNYRRKVREVPVGSLATKVLVSPDGAYLYVTCSGADPANSIIVYDLVSWELVRTARGGGGAAGMAYRAGR
jgi:YVTN family beta-propeller protein